jgi:hypothetical protein
MEGRAPRQPPRRGIARQFTAARRAALRRRICWQPIVERSSTDANVPLANGIDAISIGAGGTGGGAHSLQEWYEPAGRELGLKRVLLTLLGASGLAEEKAR